MRKFIFFFIVITLSACSAQPPVPEDHFYRLPAINLATTSVIADELAVKRFLADGLHSERAILYSNDKAPLQLKQYHYHHWTDTPPRMLQENVISALRGAGIAQNVMNYDAAVRSQFTLRGKIRKFEQFKKGNDSVVLIDVELRVDDRSGKALLIKDYAIEQAASSSTPHDLVSAFGKGIETILNNFVRDWQASK